MSDQKVARGGTFCGPVGAVAVSSVGRPLVCKLKDGAKRARWNAAGPRVRQAAGGTGRKKPNILEMNRRQLLRRSTCWPRDAGTTQTTVERT